MKGDLGVFGACADETRLRLLFLLTQRELCVCELVEVLDMPQGKVSRHLAVLKRVGLVRDRREGTWIYYALEAPATELKKKLDAYLRAQGEKLAVPVRDLARLRELAAKGQICAPRQTRKAGTGRQ